MKNLLTILILSLSLICKSQSAEDFNREFILQFNQRLKIYGINKQYTNYFKVYLDKRLEFLGSYSKDTSLKEPKLTQFYKLPEGCPLSWVEFEYIITDRSGVKQTVSKLVDDLCRNPNYHIKENRYTFWGCRFTFTNNLLIMSLIQSNFTNIWRPNEPKNH